MLGPVSDDVVFVYEATSEVDRQRELDTAGKLLFAAVVDLTTGGHLKAFQTDEANDRTLRLPRAAGRFPHVAVQLTTIEPSTGMAVEVSRHFSDEEAVPEHPAFWYAIQVIPRAARVETCWLLPSAAFNHLARRSTSENGITLTLSPRSMRETARFVVASEDLGSRLTGIARDHSGSPPHVTGALLLARAHEPGDSTASQDV